MIGTKFYKDTIDYKAYAECASWCNENGKATIEDKCDYYECVEIIIPIEDLQKSKIAELKSARDAEELSPIEALGFTWDFDDKAQMRINGAIAALGAEDSLTWTSADNKEIESVTADMLRKVIAAAAVRSNMLHIKYRILKESVQMATTEEEIQAIVW